MGRKLTIIVGNGIMVVGAIIQCSCHGPAQLIVGRIISGIGNGELIYMAIVELCSCHRNEHLHNSTIRC